MKKFRQYIFVCSFLFAFAAAANASITIESSQQFTNNSKPYRTDETLFFENTVWPSCSNPYTVLFWEGYSDGRTYGQPTYAGQQMTALKNYEQWQGGGYARTGVFVIVPPYGTSVVELPNQHTQHEAEYPGLLIVNFCGVDAANSIMTTNVASGYSSTLSSGDFLVPTGGRSYVSLVGFNGSGDVGNPSGSTKLNALPIEYGTGNVGGNLTVALQTFETGYHHIEWSTPGINGGELSILKLEDAAPVSNISINDHTIDAFGNVNITGTCHVIGTGQGNLDIYANTLNDPKLLVGTCTGQSGQTGTFIVTYPTAVYGTSTIYVIAAMENSSLNRDSIEINRAMPPSNLTILEPLGDMSVRGRTIELAGICEPYYVSGLDPEDAKLSTLALTSDFSPGMQGPIMDEPSCTCEPDPNNFLWGAFDCFYTSKDYTTKRVYVVDTMDYRNFDSRDFSFSDYNSVNLSFNPYFNISTEFGAEAKFKISPVEIYDTQGFNINAVPLVITFDQDAMASSTNTFFYLYDYTVSTSSPTALASSTISGLGLNGDRQIGYELDLSILHTRTLYGKVTDQSGKVLQGMSIIFNYHPLFFPTPPLDFGDIFPRIKNALKDKFIFHQFFYAYDTLLANFTKIVPEVVPQFPMKFISGNQQYNLTIPALDFESAPVKYFAQNLRPMGDGLLWLGFIVYIFFRIIGAFSPDDK